MQDKNFLHSIVRVCFGKKYILMMTDTAEIMARAEEMQTNENYKEVFNKISQSIQFHVISGSALSIALSLSLQRYFPSNFSVFNLNKVLFDIGLATFCLFTATNMSLKRNSNEISKIKKDLMLKYDRQFLNHMASIQLKFEIDEEDQVRGLFTQEEYKNWVQKRHQHIF